MVSVLTNTPNRHCHFYLLTDYISEKNKGRFSQVEKQYANCSIHYQLITEKIFDSFHRNIDYLVSPVSYYRYIIPELYPQLDKALYLDGDLVVNGSLEKLWDTDITDYLCAGVHDLWIENINYKPQIGFSSDELYINGRSITPEYTQNAGRKDIRKTMRNNYLAGKTDTIPRPRYHQYRVPWPSQRVARKV